MPFKPAWVLLRFGMVVQIRKSLERGWSIELQTVYKSIRKGVRRGLYEDKLLSALQSRVFLSTYFLSRGLWLLFFCSLLEIVLLLSWFVLYR